MASPCLSFPIYRMGTGLVGFGGGFNETACKVLLAAWEEGQLWVWALSLVPGEPGRSIVPAGRVTGKQLRPEEFRDSPRLHI